MTGRLLDVENWSQFTVKTALSAVCWTAVVEGRDEQWSEQSLSVRDGCILVLRQ